MSCGNPHATHCDEVLEHVYQYLDGELDASDCAKIRQHLDECSPCLSEYNLDVVLKALVRRSCGCEAAPDDLRTRIMVRITEIRTELSVAGGTSGVVTHTLIAGEATPPGRLN